MATPNVSHGAARRLPVVLSGHGLFLHRARPIVRHAPNPAYRRRRLVRELAVHVRSVRLQTVIPADLDLGVGIEVRGSVTEVTGEAWTDWSAA
jgi:hypothetical protein